MGLDQQMCADSGKVYRRVSWIRPVMDLWLWRSHNEMGHNVAEPWGLRHNGVVEIGVESDVQ